MAGLRDIAIDWYRKAFGAPPGSDIREEGLDTVLDGNTAVAVSEAAIQSRIVDDAEGPRGIVAAATGLALAGKRATAFLSGQDLAAVQDLLISAAGKHVPLVLHVRAAAAASHGSANGSAHDTVHLSAESGFFMLVACNVQQAVDFTYIARRVAEETLVPGMVVMDGGQTASAAQNVRLLSPAQSGTLLGSATDEVEAPTEAQKLLFGETRRRVPAWHDLDEPVLSGALFDAESFALGAFARRPYFDALVDESLTKSFELFAAKTGRQHESTSRYRLDDAKTVLVAQGAAVETACVAADHMRRHHKLRVGVIGVHALRPFPGDEIANALRGRAQVYVLERVAPTVAGDPPLTREISGQCAECTPVFYGVGGLPLRVADLVALCTETRGTQATTLFLGLAFDDASGDQPKREVLLDALRRAYPDVAECGVFAGRDTKDPVREKTLTISIRGANEGLVSTAGALLHSLEGGRVRSRTAQWICHGNESMLDPGDAPTADIIVDASRGVILQRSESTAFKVPLEAGGDAKRESLLGGLFGMLVRTGLLDARARSVASARRDLLRHLDDGRRDALVAAFENGLEQAAQIDPADARIEGRSEDWQGEVPAAVHHLARDDDHFASLPRFWDQLGVLYRDGMSNRLTADPYLATGTMPPLSSTFNDQSATRNTLPVFDPSLCTGCGLCWTHCPDSAIGVSAIGPAALIDTAISKTGAEPVRQVASKLASRMIANSKKSESPASTFGQMLDESVAWLEEKAPLPEERKQAIHEGVEHIGAEFGALQVAITRPFFHDAEAQKKDGAELLSVAINPDACKSCGICSKACEPGALSTREQDASRLDEARRLWTTWTGTPDTSSETLERAAEHPDVGPMAAILLSRYCQFALAGGDRGEGGSGEKMAVRLFLSATEFHQQPIAQRFAQSLQDAGKQVSALIRETLSGTLAVDDLDAVTEKLTATTSPRVDLRTLAEGAGETAEDHSVDTRHLLRLIELSKRIASAHHRLVEGEHGLGRARYGLTVTGGSATSWAGTFPENPFQAPAVIDMTGDGAQLAAGLIEGHLDETTELVRLLRLARLEVDRPDGADWKREALDKLHWQDLSNEELELCPPLVLVGSDDMLAGRGLSQLIWLLNSRLPVKILALSSLDFGIQDGHGNPRNNLGLLALAQRNAFVAQSSIGHPAHLGDSLLQALQFEGPALLQVYAPSPGRHGFASDDSLRQAQLAVESRTLPLFRYDPTAEGVFGLRISLDGNAQTDSALVSDTDTGACMTPADWALGQDRFAANFKPLASDAQTPMPLHEWLQMDAKGRERKTPYIVLAGDEDEQRFAMTPALLEMAGQCMQNWQTLQELAGIVTPFTERLEKEIRAEVEAEHQAELDAQKKASEAQVREVQEKTELEIAGKIRSRLMQLASRKKG